MTEIRVFFTDPSLSTAPTLISELTSWLDANERSRMQRFVHAHDRHLFLISHALMRKVLSQIIHCHPGAVVLQHSERGKPFIDPSIHRDPPMFSLTHTAGLAAIAISDSSVGLDAEKIVAHGTETELAKQFFSQQEAEDIIAGNIENRSRRFLTYWTLKESFLKAEGWGLVDDLDQYEFQLKRNSDTMPISVAMNLKDPKIQPTRPWKFWTSVLRDQYIISAAYCDDMETNLGSTSANTMCKLICEAVTQDDWMIDR